MRTSPPQLVISVPRDSAAGFASLLQYGFLLAVDKPVALLPLLLSLPGFTAEYLEKTVQTIFINGVAADRLDQPLSGGGTVALSAAMPGLAGAIFRRQGIHGVLRSTPKGGTGDHREHPAISPSNCSTASPPTGSWICCNGESWSGGRIFMISFGNGTRSCNHRQ